MRFNISLPRALLVYFPSPQALLDSSTIKEASAEEKAPRIQHLGISPGRNKVLSVVLAISPKYTEKT